MRSKSLRTSIVACVLALTAPAVSAQSEYPAKPVRLVHGFTAGGISDVLARSIGARLTTSLGQPVVVDPRPGAGTTIASDYIAK
jgi:tripartite-type tricarboxylate transporter receptor subunit TctC